MTLGGYAIDLLARRLLSGQVGILSADELDSVLSWLSGGQRNGAAQLTAVLGPPSHCPQVVSILYRALDQQLLAGGELNAALAHIGGARSDSERKARFRRLIQAFHPDRFPELSAWLTPRAQIIHLAYAAFKRGEPLPGERRLTASDFTNSLPTVPEGSTKPIVPAKKTAAHPWQTGPFRRSAKLVPKPAGRFQRLLGRIRNSPNLSRFIIATLAFVGLVPLLLLNLLDDRPPVSTLSAKIESPGVDAAHRRSAPPALREQHLPNQSASVRVVSASRLESSNVAEKESEAQRVSKRPESLPKDHGTIASEAQVRQLIHQLGLHITGGEIEALYRMLEGTPVGPEAGMDNLADHYHDIIAGSRRRHQDFQILSIEHHPPYRWTIKTLSRLTMALDDLTARHKEAVYEVTIDQAADGQLKITRFDGQSPF